MGCLTTLLLYLRLKETILMAKQMYNVTVGNETVEVFTLKEVKELLGDNKITTKGILAGEYDLVTIADMEEEQSTTLQELADASDNIEVIMVGDAPAKEDLEEEIETTVDTLPDTVEEFMEEATPQVLTNTEEDTQVLTNKEVEEDIADEPIQSDTEFPEVGDFEDEKAIKKYIKKLTNEELEAWCVLEGAEYKPTDHESINRMRMAMAIKETHFPHLKKTPGTKKSKSKYADYTTEQLVQMAMENDVEVRDDKGDMRILRMYTIMALKEAKILS